MDSSNNPANRPIISRFLAVKAPLAVLIVVLGFAGPPVESEARPGGGQNPSIIRNLALVDSLLAVGDLDLAVTEARQLQRDHGQDPYHGWQIDSRVGVGLLRLGDPEAALPSLESAVRKAPGRSEVHRNLGAALVQMGRRGRALAEFTQAVELAPDQHLLRLEYGQLLLDFGDTGRAQVHLERAAHLCGDCPEVQEPLARLYLATGRPLEAAGILEDVYRSRQTDGVRRSLIQAWHQAGQDSVLLGFLGRAMNPGMAADEVMLLLEMEGKLGQYRFSEEFALTVSDGEKEAATVPQAVRGRPDFWGRVSYNLMLAGRDRPALAAVNRAINLDDSHVVYRNNRVVLLTRLGLHEEAAREWKKVLALDPSLEERQ
jgi:Flp pilus assembly protein TadD